MLSVSLLDHGDITLMSISQPVRFWYSLHIHKVTDQTSVAGMLKKLSTSKGDYCIKQ